MKTLEHLFDMSGKRVLITGAAGRIGFTVAETFAELGASLVLCDKNMTGLQQARAKLRLHWDACEIDCVECDLEIESERIHLGAEFSSQSRSICSLVHCAGFVGSTKLDGWVGKFETQSMDTWRRAMEVNLSSAFHLSQLFSENLAQSKGSIILFSSIYGVLGPDYSLYADTDMGNPAAYAASKGGLIQLARWLSTTMAPHVRVNCVSPGGVYRQQDERFVERYQANTPLARMATEDDFKGVVALLATEAGSYITGQNIMVDGGWSTW